jgi:hypothetical protein
MPTECGKYGPVEKEKPRADMLRLWASSRQKDFDSENPKDKGNRLYERVF